MADVFMCERGQLDDRSKRDLRKAGIVVVEVDDPTKCQFTRASELVSGDDMLYAAMKALQHEGDSYNKGNDQREQLAWQLIKLVDAAHAKANGTQPTFA